tara:strand:- start:499 stop:621 length:123 start_codon:yes stop_codon:yes gene_type:complete
MLQAAMWSIGWLLNCDQTMPEKQALLRYTTAFLKRRAILN